MIFIEKEMEISEDRLHKAVEEHETHLTLFEKKTEVAQELNEQLKYESLPEKQLEKYREECETYFKEWRSVNKSNYDDKIDKLSIEALRLYEKGNEIRSEVFIEDIGLINYDEYSMNIDEEVTVDEFFEELNFLIEQFLYEYDAYRLIEKFGEEISTEQQVVALRKEGFSITQILTAVEDLNYLEVAEICKNI